MSLHINSSTEGTYPFEVILSEGESIAREKVTLIAGQDLAAGTVLGQITKGAITVGAVTFVGTGNGTCTKASTAYSTAAVSGNYVAACVEKTTDSGLFTVRRPDGTIDGYAVIGTAYDGQVKFTIADGATDFAQGDAFTIPVTVAAASLKYTLHDNAATDGSEVAAAVLLTATNATADTTVLVLARLTEVIGSLLVWKSGISGANKTAGIAALAIKHIIVR